MIGGIPCVLLQTYGVEQKRALALLGSHTYSVRAFRFGRRVCRLSVCLSVPHVIAEAREGERLRLHRVYKI